MLNAEKLAHLNIIIQTIYKSTVDPNEWETLLRLLADLFNSHLVSNLDQNAKTGKAKLLHSIGYSEKSHIAYGEYYGPRSVLVKDLRNYQQGEVFVDQMLTNYDSYLNSETYNDFFDGLHDGAHGMCLITKNYHNLLNYFVLRRSKNHGFFDEDEFEMASLLLPHLIQANQIAEKLENKNILNKSFESAFNHLPLGIVIVNRNVEVKFSNTTAEQIFNRNDGLSMSLKKLFTTDENDSTTLKKNISQALDMNLMEPLNATQTCLVNRNVDARPYRLSVIPLIQDACVAEAVYEFALITIYDPDTSPINNEALIADLYQLTQAEARVAQGFCNGLNTAEIANLYNISDNGVRFHTKNIFQKLQVNRQSEVVSLILNGPISLLFNKESD